MIASPSYQRGMGLGQLVLGGFVFILLFIFVIKLVPAYMENEKIKNIFVVLANDPEMQKASPYEIQVAFEKRGSIDGVSAIKPADIQIGSNNGMLYLSASYELRVPLIANISLLLEFNPTSAK